MSRHRDAQAQIRGRTPVEDDATHAPEPVIETLEPDEQLQSGQPNDHGTQASSWLQKFRRSAHHEEDDLTVDGAPIEDPPSRGQSARIVDVESDAPLVGNVQRAKDRVVLSATPRNILPSIALDAGRLGPHWLAAGSLVGRRHKANGETRQDSYAFGQSMASDAIVVAVADGLGSKPSSQVGSSLFASLLCEKLAEQTSKAVDRDGRHAFVHSLKSAQVELVRRWLPSFGIKDPREVATTIVAARIPNDVTAAKVQIIRVGDANAFCGTGDAVEPFTSIFDEDQSETPINAVSASIPSTQDLASIVEYREFDASEFSKIILCTDGFSDDMYDSPKVREWLANKWQFPCSEQWMHDSLSYTRRGSHDDRTAVVVWLKSDKSGDEYSPTTTIDSALEEQ